MTRLIVAVCIALAASLCLAAASSAHRVNLFAYVDGDSVFTESGYSRSRRVNKGVVEVHDAASGKLLLTGTTDGEGRYSFPIPAEAREGKMDLLLVLKAGEGHQAEWTVKYDEFGSGGEAAEAAASETSEPAAPAGAEPAAAATSAPTAAVDTAAIKAVVHSELAPVKRMLAEMHDSGPGFTEILGGIGYIFGLFGVAAYMKSRKSA
jgi:nickel transport protein